MPGLVISGPGAIESLGGEARRLGPKRYLLVTDAGVKKAGILDKVQSSLGSVGVDFMVFDGVEPDPTLASVDACARAGRDYGADGIIGVGGGSPIDVAKSAGALLANPGSIRDYLGLDRIPSPAVPKIIIPTTAGTGSEASQAAVLTDEVDQIKKAVYSRHLRSDLAILDPALTLSMPVRVTLDTGLDALTHAIEGYTSYNANPLSEATGIAAIQAIAQNLPLVVARPDNLKARESMLVASLMAGMSFTFGGLCGVHALAYSLGSDYHMTHGRSNAVLLPHVTRFNLIGAPEKYARIARALGKDVNGLGVREAAEAAVSGLLRLMEDVGVSPRLRDYGIPEDRLEYLAEKSHRFGGRLLPNNPRLITEKDAVQIFRAAW